MARKPPPTPTSANMSIDEALNRAQAHWNAGQADQAELFCQRVLAIWPGQADALHLLGVMAHAYGNLDLGIEHLRQACQAPRTPAVYFSNLAEMCRQKGLLEEGERAGRRATALAPGLTSAWNNLGIILQEAGKLDESAACLERVIAIQPDAPEAHNNLANTYKRMGRLDRAADHYAKALDLHPNYAEAHSNLANLLNDLGRFDEAERHGRMAIDIKPQLADAYLNLANIETERQRYGEALRWIDKLLAFAPTYPGALVARASILKHHDDLNEALDAAKHAVAAAPQSPEAHNILGEILQALNMLDQAKASYEKAIGLPGTVAETTRNHLANLLLDAGLTTEALAAYDTLLERNPLNVRAWFARSEIKKFTADDPDIGRMEALLGPQGIQSLKDRMTVHFALGKAYLDIGQSETAFRHLNEGNRLKRQTFAYNADATEQWMQTFAATVTPSLRKSLKGKGDPSDLPIFVLGMPRSGTTLIEHILASHPQVHGAGELGALHKIVATLNDYPACLSTLGPDDARRLAETYLEQVRPMASGKRHVIDKMPSNFLHAGLINLILPNARIIHCRRDPVDTCLSCYTKLFAAEQTFAYDQTELGRFHNSYQKMMAHWRKVLPKNRFIEVDYELVVDDMEGQVRKVLDFLGLPWDDACLRFHETKRTVKTASLTQVRQPVYKSSVGRWKAHADQLAPLLQALNINAT